MRLTDVKINDIVYCIEPFQHKIIKGRVFDKDIDGARIKKICFVDEDGLLVERCTGTATTPWENTYLSAKEAFVARDRKASVWFKSFCSEMNTIEDVLRFPLYSNAFNNENYIGDIARKAYRTRAEELGFNLEEKLTNNVYYAAARDLADGTLASCKIIAPTYASADKYARDFFDGVLDRYEFEINIQDPNEDDLTLDPGVYDDAPSNYAYNIFC